jgi:hypothetical protein
VELGKTLIIPCNIFMDARYHHVNITNDKITIPSSKISLNKSIKKLNALSIEEECKMLTKAMC